MVEQAVIETLSETFNRRKITLLNLSTVMIAVILYSQMIFESVRNLVFYSGYSSNRSTRHDAESFGIS